jgi:hypothetical protein
MIIRSLCNSCFQTYELMVEPGEVHLVKQVATDDGITCPCPRLCGGKINLAGDPAIEAMTKGQAMRTPLPLSGKELYKAVMGAGLPDEIPQAKETLEALLKANKVVGMMLEEDDKKFYLHELKLENGLTLHLASGLRGAQVLKVTKERM